MCRKSNHFHWISPRLVNLDSIALVLKHLVIYFIGKTRLITFKEGIGTNWGLSVEEVVRRWKKSNLRQSRWNAVKLTAWAPALLRAADFLQCSTSICSICTSRQSHVSPPKMESRQPSTFTVPIIPVFAYIGRTHTKGVVETEQSYPLPRSKVYKISGSSQCLRHSKSQDKNRHRKVS